MNYRHDGKQRTITFGLYPDLNLSAARAKRDKARGHLANGLDPAIEEKRLLREAAVSRDNTFGTIADEYLKTLEGKKRTAKTLSKNEWQLKRLAASLLDMPITDIKAADVLDVIKHVEASGRIDTAHRIRAAIGAVFRLAIQTNRAEHDPTQALRGALLPNKAKPQAAVIGEKEFGPLLRSIDEYDGWTTLRAALQIMALCYPRPVELRKAEWSHVNLSMQLWTVPEHLTKMRREHIIPLSTQAVAVFEDVAKFSGKNRLIFPSIRNMERPLSENAMNSALRRMGYRQEEHTAHGFRSSASTILNERGFRYDVIEASLAHLDPNEVRRTYNRTSYLKERIEMAQQWADICDELKSRKGRNNDDLI